MSIFQQVVIDAYPREVYEVLADAAALSALSGMSGTAAHGEGAEFTAFDGHVTGRQIELVPGIKIVQAWRFPVWEPGTCTLVRFTLTAEPAGLLARSTPAAAGRCWSSSSMASRPGRTRLAATRPGVIT
jgi:uncharacterized protein YndB with AHSA1/START domain